MTATASTEAMEMITARILLQIGQILFDLVLILVKRRIVDRQRADLNQWFRFSVLPDEKPDYYQTERPPRRRARSSRTALGGAR